jgi:transposase-like protein
VAIPVMIPLAAAAVTYGVIKDKFIKCPQCGSRKVELQGSSPVSRRGCFEIPEQAPRRQSPVYSFYLCRDCGCRSKKLFGSPLEKASEEEFAQLIPPTPK